MAKNIKELLKNRKASKAKLKEKISSEKSGNTKEKDPRFWDHKHIINEKTKKGMAKFRFLPAPPGEDEPYVKLIGYFQQSPYNKSYYVHNSHKTYDEDAEDPAYEHNGEMYKKYDEKEAKKHTIRRQKKYISNILMIDDPKEPENNGKVFLYEYGPMIFNMIQALLEYDEDLGETEDDSFDAFDPIENAVFHLKVTPKDMGNSKGHTYETSEFVEVGSPITEDDDELEEIWKKCHKLQPLVDPEDEEIFAPIEKQKKDFARWLGEEDTNEEPKKSEKKSVVEDEDEPESEEEDDKLPWEDEDDDSDNSDDSSDEDEDDEDIDLDKLFKDI